MSRKTKSNLYKQLEKNLMRKSFLRRIGITKTAMSTLLSEHNWREKVNVSLEQEEASCTRALDLAKETLQQLSPEPEEGWLSFIYDDTIAALFPDNYSVKEDEAVYEKGKLFYLELVRTLFYYQRKTRGFSPVLNMELLSEDEIQNCNAREEYLTFLQFFREHYLMEFMYIGKEISPFNTVGHISGVHFVALCMARQMIAAGMPVDLALVSGAAAGHDIGKYGCKGEEARRTPYLHYYYTDQFLNRNEMPLIAHIASNHSTWDLELENLSVESLLLIYADFRVKSDKETGREIVNFYTLEEAFNVILNKLDNVDKAKVQRYKKVYAKLEDFEAYMKSLGVRTDLESEELEDVSPKDPALLQKGEVIDRLKYLAIEHNIKLMTKFNNEAAFGNLIEAARSEAHWKNIRTYINILEEYSTYMTQKQKLMTIHFLSDLLIHREGDIRRQAAALIGNMIANYDEEYRKELPQGVEIHPAEMNSYRLWQETLDRIIFPGHKVTEQHKRWIGYALKIVFLSVLENCKKQDETQYLRHFLAFFKKEQLDDATIFILLDSALSIPLDLCSGDEIAELIDFCEAVSRKENLEIQTGVLRFLKYVTEYHRSNTFDTQTLNILSNIKREHQSVCILFLKYKVKEAMGIIGKEALEYEDTFYERVEMNSEMFLENLKVDTPWVIKAVNIEILLEEVKEGRSEQILHVATHLSNLLKVSERVTVRHIAGKGLLEVVPLLPLDQRNEVVIELTKGLGIGEYEFSKYIPQYLGALALYLHPNELNEFVNNLSRLLESTNERVGSVALDTLGEMLKRYPQYRSRFDESKQAYDARKKKILGMLLRGIANYNQVVSQEAFMVIGQHIFGSKLLSLERKARIFQRIDKKLLTLLVDQKEDNLTFFTNAASLNHIYRFISEYILKKGEFKLPKKEKVAFFPGTFDPFSLSHKGIIHSILELGFEVYLALDEFSWSKKTQARMIRRKIITMSMADEENVFLFPDNAPINIANPKDLKNLKSLFPGKELFIVVGSDVIVNASSYKMAPVKDSIHSLNHVVFRRESQVEGDQAGDDLTEAYKAISGDVVELTLPVHLEDISSTRIRENIDDNRDISNLIDPVAQNYIYEYGLYLREPQYKSIMQTKAIQFESLIHRGSAIASELFWEIKIDYCNVSRLRDYLDQPKTRSMMIRDGNLGNRICAFAALNEIDKTFLYEQFQNADLAAYLRKKATGRIVAIRSLFTTEKTQIRDMAQMILTEVLGEILKEDFTYAVYQPMEGMKTSHKVIQALERQGFREVILGGEATGIYEVDMKNPVSVFQNMDTVLKEPFNKNEKILDVMEQAHMNLQMALTKLYPGNLVLSFNSGVIHHKIINMVTKYNGVSSEPDKSRKLGPYMCVPFGKILRGMAVPNTVTKTLHTEKLFNPDIKGFSIEEFPYYSLIENQVKTIQSFDRPVILVDDLLHKGYRMKELDPVLKRNGVRVSKLVVGMLSGDGKDLMTIQGRTVDSVYFVPNLRNWFVESTLYPFIGGDGVKRESQKNSGMLSSVNMILPYVAPGFLEAAQKSAAYDYSMVCLENARSIFLALEEEYQNTFERKLTLQRLSEVVISPRLPDLGKNVEYDMNLAPSGYLLNGIERLMRLEDMTK